MVVDVLTARNCGIDVAVIATGSASIADLEKAQPDYFLQQFSDLLGIVSPEPGHQGLTPPPQG